GLGTSVGEIWRDFFHDRLRLMLKRSMRVARRRIHQTRGGQTDTLVWSASSAGLGDRPMVGGLGGELIPVEVGFPRRSGRETRGRRTPSLTPAGSLSASGMRRSRLLELRGMELHEIAHARRCFAGELV